MAKGGPGILRYADHVSLYVQAALLCTIRSYAGPPVPEGSRLCGHAALSLSCCRCASCHVLCTHIAKHSKNLLSHACRRSQRRTCPHSLQQRLLLEASKHSGGRPNHRSRLQPWRPSSPILRAWLRRCPMPAPLSACTRPASTAPALAAMTTMKSQMTMIALMVGPCQSLDSMVSLSGLLSISPCFIPGSLFAKVDVALRCCHENFGWIQCWNCLRSALHHDAQTCTSSAMRQPRACQKRM